MSRRSGADPSRTARIAVLSGPGGVGKGTVIAALRGRLVGWTVSVSVTTRAPRRGERDGVAYRFVDDARFDRMVADDELLEWASFGGHRYGTPWRTVRDAMADGRSVLLELEINGALAVKKEFPHAVLIFLHPPDLGALVRRLRERGADDDQRVAERLALAEWELAQASAFDHHVVNDDVEAAVDMIARILASGAA